MSEHAGPLAFAPLPGALEDFRGRGYVEYWHGGPSETRKERRKQRGIMPASWSQATLHSSMPLLLLLLPLTDMNKRNQLDLLGCCPRDFYHGKGGRNQSI